MHRNESADCALAEKIRKETKETHNRANPLATVTGPFHIYHAGFPTKSESFNYASESIAFQLLNPPDFESFKRSDPLMHSLRICLSSKIILRSTSK